MTYRQLPNDYCRCTNETCPLKEDCLRWLDKPESGCRTPFAQFKPEEDGTCNNQIKTHES